MVAVAVVLMWKLRSWFSTSIKLNINI